MSIITITTWKWRLQYKPRSQRKKFPYQEYETPTPASSEAEAQAAQTAKIVELETQGFKIIETSMWPSHRSIGTADRAILLIYRTTGILQVVENFHADNWEEIDKAINRSIFTCCYGFEDVSHADIYYVMPEQGFTVPEQVLVHQERRPCPEYMKVFYQLRDICRDQIKPYTDYNLLHRYDMAGFFTLQVRINGTYETIFDHVALDNEALQRVQQYAQAVATAKASA